MQDMASSLVIPLGTGGPYAAEGRHLALVWARPNLNSDERASSDSVPWVEQDALASPADHGVATL
jgi:hypothetical protein